MDLDDAVAWIEEGEITKEKRPRRTVHPNALQGALKTCFWTSLNSSLHAMLEQIVVSLVWCVLPLLICTLGLSCTLKGFLHLLQMACAGASTEKRWRPAVERFIRRRSTLRGRRERKRETRSWARYRRCIRVEYGSFAASWCRPEVSAFMYRSVEAVLRCFIVSLWTCCLIVLVTLLRMVIALAVYDRGRDSRPADTLDHDCIALALVHRSLATCSSIGFGSCFRPRYILPHCKVHKQSPQAR